MGFTFGEMQLSPGGAATHDDNIENVILTKIAQGGLVRITVPANALYVGGGSATAASGTPNAEPSGAQAGAILTVPAGAGNSAKVESTLYGRLVGVRFQRSTSTSVPPFSLIVNGVVEPVRNSQARRHSQLAAITDAEGMVVIVGDLLSDGPHTVCVSVVAPASGTRTLTLYGFVVERDKGYAEFPRTGLHSTAAVAIGTSATSMSGAGATYIQRISLNNTTAATRTLTFKVGSTVIRTVQLAASGTAGDSVDYDFPVPIQGGITIQADATGVNAIVLQGARQR